MNLKPPRRFFADSIERLTGYLEQNHVFSLAFIFAVALGLRLYNLDYQSLSLEELQAIKSAREVQALKMSNSSIYSLILHLLFEMTNYSEWAGRLLSVCFGLFGIWIIFCLGTELVNKNAGLFCAFLTALNYYHILCSQEITIYSMLFSLVLVSYYFFLRSLKHIGMDMVWYCFFTTILVCTHFIGLLVICIQLITVLFVIGLWRKQRSKYALAWFVTFCVVGFAFLPWAEVVIKEISIFKYWVPYYNPSLFLAFYFRYFNNDLVMVYVFLAFLAYPFYLTFLSEDVKSQKIANQDLFAIGLLVVVSFVVLYFSSTHGTVILYIKYTFTIFPLAIVIASVTYSSIQKTQIRFSILLIVLLSTFIQFFFINHYYDALRSPQIKEVARVVVNSHDGKSPIFSNYGELIDFYFAKSDNLIPVRESRSKTFRQEIRKQENFWLVEVYDSVLNRSDKDFVDSLFVIEVEYKYWNSKAVKMKSKQKKRYPNY